MAVAASTLASIHGPGNPGQVYPPAYHFLANWPPGGQPLVVRTGWETDRVQAVSLAQERRGLLSKPARLLRFDTHSRPQDETFWLQAALQRLGTLRSLVPLHSDFARVTGGSGNNAILNVEQTAYRRFFQGARALYLDPDRRTAGQQNFTVGTISSVGATSITFTGSVGGIAATARGRVYPLIEAGINYSSEVEIQTDRILKASIEALEVRGETALSALVTPGTIPTGWDEYADLPLLTIRPSINRGRLTSRSTRVGGRTPSGRSTIDGAYGDRPIFEKGCGWSFLSRADAWPLLEFFDSRGGMTYPFLMPTWLDEFVVEDLQLGWVDVTENGNVLFDLSNYAYIGLLLWDGTWIVRGIDSTEDPTGDVHRVLFDTDITATDPEDVRLCCGVLKCTFASDEIEERWLTDQKVDISVDVVEVVEEKSVDLGDPLNVLTPDEPIGVTDLSGWYDVARSCLCSKSRGDAGGDDDITPWRQCITVRNRRDNLSDITKVPSPQFRRRALWMEDLSGGSQHLYAHENGSVSGRPFYVHSSPLDPVAFDTGGRPFVDSTGGDMDDIYGGVPSYFWHATNGITVFALAGQMMERAVPDFTFVLGDNTAGGQTIFQATNRWQLRTDGFFVTPAGGGAAVGADIGSGRWAWSIFVGRYEPSTRIDFWRRPAQTWINGVFPDDSDHPEWSINPSGSDDVQSTQASQSVGVPAALDSGGAGYSAFGTLNRVSIVRMYDRPLTAGEINTVGAFMAIEAGGVIPWFDVSL